MTPARGIHQLRCKQGKCAKGKVRIDHAYCISCPNVDMDILDTDRIKILSVIPLGDLQKGKEKKKVISKTK